MRTGPWERQAGTKHDAVQCAGRGWGATEGEGECTGPDGERCAWERAGREHGLEATVVTERSRCDWTGTGRWAWRAGAMRDKCLEGRTGGIQHLIAWVGKFRMVLDF